MKPCEAARAFSLFGDVDLTVHSSLIFLRLKPLSFIHHLASLHHLWALKQKVAG